MRNAIKFAVIATVIAAISTTVYAPPPENFDGKPAPGRYQLLSVTEERENNAAILRPNLDAPKMIKEVVIYRLDTWTGRTWKLYPFPSNKWVELEEQRVPNKTE